MTSLDPPPFDDPAPVDDPARPDGPGAGSGTIPPGGEPTDERLDFRVVPAWMVSGLVSLAVLTALGVGATGLFGSEIRSELPWLPTAALGLLALMVLWTVLQPLLAWQRWRFRVDDRLLSARYGIVFHEEKIIPMSRLQHVDLTRGPIERAFGLATLIVHTAGSEGATFRLPGLRDARARALREQVLEARGDDVV